MKLRTGVISLLFLLSAVARDQVVKIALHGMGGVGAWLGCIAEGRGLQTFIFISRHDG